MRFLPLAMSIMGGDGICLAGLDVETKQWVRPVQRGYGCLFREQVAGFRANAYHKVELGAASGSDT